MIFLVVEVNTSPLVVEVNIPAGGLLGTQMPNILDTSFFAWYYRLYEYR